MDFDKILAFLEQFRAYVAQFFAGLQDFLNGIGNGWKNETESESATV